MQRNNRRQSPGSRFPERRHHVRNQLTATGIGLGLVVIVIILYQLWHLLQG